MVDLKHWILHEAGVALLEFALVAVLALSLAYWTWAAVTPRTVAAPAWVAQLPASGRGPLVRRNLFGAAPDVGSAAAAGSTSAGLRLLGVFSGKTPGKGRAILAGHGGKPEAFAAGEAIADGLVLQQVFPDHVIVLRDGAPERVDLERVGTPAASPPAGRAPVRR